MDSLTTNKKTINVLMFPWLAHGHISPYLELAKRLATRNFIVHLCSTPANLSSIKHKIGEKYSFSIRQVELHLGSSILPPCYHTTNGLPPELMPKLKQAFESIETKKHFFRILETLKPDLLVYDFLQPWAPTLASLRGVPAVEFITSSSTMTAYMFHFFVKPEAAFPFRDVIEYRDYELVHRDRLLAAEEKVKRDALDGVVRSSKIVLIKGFKEIEGDYLVYLEKILGKKFVPVGPLVQDPNDDVHVSDGTGIMTWLDGKPKASTVYVSFGSEYFLSQEDLTELAHGLETSNVNFVWVVRFPKGSKITLEEALPLGFLERVGERGLVVAGWAPQASILGHVAMGGFVSHCGVSSMMESMKFGVPIIAMPMHLDQPLNARLAVAVGVGDEVVRDETTGRLKRDEVAAVIRRVVVEGGEVRRGARRMSERIREKGDEEIDEVVVEFVGLCMRNKKKMMMTKINGNGFH